MAGSITSADAVVTLWQPILFPTPLQLQQFAVDDIYDTDQIRNVEAQMGVDGTLSFGFVYAPIMQNFALQANSPSIAAFFDPIYAQQILGKTVYPISGTIALPSLGKKWAMTNGAMTDYKPMPDAKRVLQMQRFRVTWNQVLPSPL